MKLELLTCPQQISYPTLSFADVVFILEHEIERALYCRGVEFLHAQGNECPCPIECLSDAWELFLCRVCVTHTQNEQSAVGTSHPALAP